MSGSGSDRDPALRSGLELCAATAAEVLRQERLDRARVRARRPVLHMALSVCTALVLIQVVAALGLWPSLGTIPVLVIGLGLPVAVFVVRIAAALRRSPSTAEVLQVVDDRLGLEDRLRTAWEFSGRERPGGFEQAALDDARPALALARGTSLTPSSAPDPGRAGDRGRFVASSVLVIAALVLVQPASPADAGSGDADIVAADLRPTSRDEVRVKPDEALRERPEPRPTEEPAAAAADPGERRPTGLEQELADAGMERGTTGRGGNSPESGSQSSSGARGHGSPRSPDPKPAESRVPERKPKKARKEREDLARPKKRPDEESGETQGRGAAGGSNRNPSASPWSSKDKVASEEDEELVEDEDVDEDDDNEDARGGMQPMLRDRKPPVNRDLSIGFGNQKNPDANGRGGPGERKKSRGVASLVLGVSIPDHVKGRPNAGRSKITQERVPPSAELAPGLDAEGASTRDRGIGPMARPVLEPWMREVLRRWFLGRRHTESVPSREE